MVTALALGVGEPVLQSRPSDWAFIADNLNYLAGGLALTIVLTLVSILLGFFAGFPAGAIEVYGGAISRSIVRFVGTVLRGTPIVVLLIFAFFVVDVPDLRLYAIELSGAFSAAVLGLGLRSAAYQSQIFRGALQSVDEGQMEAARSVGLSKLGAIRHVVVPQALRRSVPGFQNEFTIVLKDTSVAIAIGLAELLTRAQDLFVQQTTAITELILFISLIYFVLTFATNRTLDAVGDHYAIPEEEGA